LFMVTKLGKILVHLLIQTRVRYKIIR